MLSKENFCRREVKVARENWTHLLLPHLPQNFPNQLLLIRSEVVLVAYATKRAARFGPRVVHVGTWAVSTQTSREELLSYRDMSD